MKVGRMKRYPLVITAVLVLVLAITSMMILRTEPAKSNDPHDHGSEVGHDEHDDHGEPAGPNGGKLVSFGDYIVEVSIFEKGVPPEFRLYLTDNSQKSVTIDPTQMVISLARPERTDSFTFRQSDGFLQSEQEIAEPHEFTLSMKIKISDAVYDTTYFQEETHGHGAEHGSGSMGSIALSDEAIQSNDIRLEKAGPGRISHVVELPGEIVLNADKVAHIVPRFSGITLNVHKNLGDRVDSGEVLAVVQSNQSVASYDVKSMMSGTIIEKHVTLGEFVRDDADIFVIADLSTVWVAISIYPQYLGQLRIGQRVALSSTGISEKTEGTIDYIGPVVGERTRTGQARMVLRNPDRIWLPGMFVTAKIAVSETDVLLAVPDEAIQTVEGSTAVFVRVDGRFHAVPVTLGRSDGKMVEILSGLAHGDEFAASNSFLLKADFGKSEAAHDH